ncbi:MAG: M14 family zinc carboxypeptidase [Candidatus Zixiibacteriota bacterium]
MRTRSLLVFALLVASLVLWQTSKPLAFEEIYARVWVSSMEEKGRLLGERGLDVDNAGPGWVDVVVNSQQLDELVAKGYDVEAKYWTPEEKNIALYGPNWRLAFHTYAQLVDTMEQLAANFPNIVILDTLGYSVDGRMILGAKVSDNPSQEENEPEFRIIGNHHGDEYMGAEIGLDMLQYLTTNYGTITQVTHLVNDLETWIIPMMNPDGHEAGTRYNANGVDLNRDYGYMWTGEGGGAYGFSQPETRAIRLHALEHNFSISLSFHTAAYYVNYVWNYRPFPVPDSAFIVDISRPYALTTGYTLVEGYNWYQTYGDCNDWSYGSRGDIDATIETENTDITGTCNKNRPAILAMMERTDDGVRGIVTSAATGQPLDAMVTCTQLGQPVFTEKTVGDYQKNLLPGTYTLKFSANGYQDSTISGVVVSSSSPTILNVALRPGTQLFAVHVVSCYFYDNHSYPSQYLNNPTNGSAALGLPDGVCASLGKGGNIVLDMGENTKIYDVDGPDFTVTEGGPTSDGYTVSWSDLPYGGTWHLIGSGFGTTSFDIASQSTDSIRYLKIVDDNDGSATEQNPGCDIDAVTHPKPVTGAYVTLHSYRIDDDSTGQSLGNNDGNVDFGETIELRMVLENLGDSTAYNVQGTIRTTNAFVSVTDSQNTFGNIAAGDTAVSGGAFVFSVSSQIADGTTIPFQLDVTANSGSWRNQGLNIIAYAPRLVYQSQAVDDIGGNDNGKPDPGETCNLNVTLRNSGGASESGISGELSCSDPYVTLTNSHASYPSIPAGGGGTSLAPYTFTSTSDCPEGHETVMILQVSGGGSYSTTDTFLVRIGQKPILFVDDDGGHSYETYFISALDSVGLPYDVWTYATEGAPTDSLLSLYKAVVWNTGPDFGTTGSPKSLTLTDQARLTTYLDNGGNFFLSSQDLLLDNNPNDFIINYLHVAGHSDDKRDSTFAGMNGDTIANGMAFTIRPPFSNFSDWIVPGAGAAGIFRVVAGKGSSFRREGVLLDEYPEAGADTFCALRYPASGSSTYKVVFLAFAFEGVPPTGPYPNNSYILMRRIIDWFDLGRTTPSFMHGDANADHLINSGDVIFLVNYLLKGGVAPNPLEAGDANCDGVVNAGDVIYLINYLYRGGSAPPC